MTEAAVARGRSGYLRSPNRRTYCQVRCRARCLFISNMVTLSLSKTLLSLSSALTAVLGVLQVVGLDVVPDLAHHLAPGQRSWADHCGQRFGRLQRPLQRIPLAAACGGLRLLRRLLRCSGWHRSSPICTASLHAVERWAAQAQVAVLLTDQHAPAPPTPAKRRWWQWRS